MVSTVSAASSVVLPVSRLLREATWMAQPSVLPTARALEHADNEDADAPPRRARVGYLIMTSGMEELHRTKRLLKVEYGRSTLTRTVLYRHVIIMLS